MKIDTVNIFRFVSTQDLLIIINSLWADLVGDVRVLKGKPHFW
jgi:hypothetical protein